MEIVYLLTNKSKESGRRFYVGSKSGCKVVKVNGVNTIINVSNGKVYMSSSQSPYFKQDIAQGHIFEATILEKVKEKDRKRLIEIENNWIIKLNAVESDEFYNMAYATMNPHISDQVANKYGETVAELASRNSNMSKRDSSARSLGFTNFGEFAFDAYKRYKECNSWAKVSYSYGKYKNFVRISLEDFDMEKAIADLNKDCKSELRKLLRESCSLRKACEILDIELPSGRLMLGEYLDDRNFKVASLQGKTKSELEIEVSKLILDGKNFREVSNLLGITYESTKRYFLRCIRERLKSSDL